LGQAWQHKPVVLALRSLRQEDPMVKAYVGCILDFFLEKQTLRKCSMKDSKMAARGRKQKACLLK
jgi:hypothetical protein